MVGYILFCIISIVFLILYEKITVKFIYLDALKITLSFSVVELTLWNFKKAKKKRRSFRKSLKRFSAIRAMWEYIISHSEISVDRIYINRNEKSVSKNAIAAYGSYPALFSIAIAYLKRHSESITEGAVVLSTDENSPKETNFNITQHIRVYHVLLGLFNFAKGYLKKV